MEDGVHGQQGQKIYLGSEEQSQEPRVCAVAVDGSPDPIRPTGPLYCARPVPGHGACATWPALVTFQATVEESSGQVVSPSENDIRGLSSASAQAFSLSRNSCRLWSLVVLSSSVPQGNFQGGQ